MGLYGALNNIFYIYRWKYKQNP